MKIAVVGGGISGLTAAYILSGAHDVTLFEANDYLGGHTNTIDLSVGARRYAVDTGFIVYNETNYPNFTKMLAILGVASQATSMSFSVRCDRCGLEYNGTSLNRLFAQRRNLFRPSFHRMIREILRFGREAPGTLAETDDTLTVEDYLALEGYDRGFAEHYLVPMGAALWSCPPGRLLQFPIRFLVEFFLNHSMLKTGKRPTWRVVKGGSRRYVEALASRMRVAVRLGCPVRSVRRFQERVEILARDKEYFDSVILACHADTSLSILEDPSDAEKEILGSFPYQRNDVALHGDAIVLPRNRLAWASWNYHLNEGESSAATVTYDMNILQDLRGAPLFCVTLNEEARIDPARVYRRFVYHHPLYTSGRSAAWKRHGELIDSNRTSYCGAYWGYGFHEDGVRSALAVCKRFGRTL